jgi:hypothetical protein
MQGIFILVLAAALAAASLYLAFRTLQERVPSDRLTQALDLSEVDY